MRDESFDVHPLLVLNAKMRGDWLQALAERDAALAESRRHQEMVVALRATLEACFELDGYPSHDDGCPEDDTCRCKVTAMVNDVFRDSSATAQQTVERIEREAFAKHESDLVWALDIVEKELCLDDDFKRMERLRAAILGEEER